MKRGRKPGSKNRKTLLLEGFAINICEGGMMKFRQELNNMTGKDFINAYLTLFEYVQPKLQRTTVAGDPENPIGITINELKFES